MKEKDITREVLQAVKRLPLPSCALEIKLTKTDSIAFSSVVQHQVAALTHAKGSGGVIFKIPDFGAQNPFDAFYLKEAAGFVVVVFYKPRVLKRACFIDIDRWVTEQGRSNRKSLTYERAVEIATLCTVL